MKYCAAYYSDIGIQKETNQDSLLLVQRGQTQDDEAVLAVICDGVGGLKMGERSSAAVVTAFRDWFDERVEELYEQEEPETELFDDWDNLIQSLHIRLKDYSEKAGFRSGTTVEAVLFMKGRYYICHVGDCRTYIISDTLTQLTTDHTIVQRELTEGKLTPEQARKDSRQSLLLQCVGAGKDVKPDYLSGEVLPHRTFLICCDGFRRKVTEAEIKKSCRYSSKEKKLHEALEETAQLCMKRKETDNITGILISAVGEKKGLFPLWKKATQTAGKKVIKDILLEHSTPADKILQNKGDIIMEDNRKFATFFADAPKGKKIGAVLSWIATVILLVALFVPGYQLRYQMKTEKGTFKDIPATMTSELKQMKEAAKLNFQFGAGTTSDKIDEFVEKGSTSVFSYLVSPDLQKARLVNLETMSDASDDISKICVALLVLFFVLVVVAAIASVFTISWCALVANLIGIIELLAVYFFVFAGKFSIDPTDTSITSRVAPALTMILIVLLVLTAIMSVASVIVSYAVHEDEEAFVDDWNSNDPSRDAETNLVDDGNATTVPATDNSMTVVASLIQMNTNRSFAIYNNTEVVIGKGSQANIIVSNPIISRAHAKISCRNGVCTIQDLGSKNGTFVGDEKILGSNTVTLANGMYITLGNEIFQFKN